MNQETFEVLFHMFINISLAVLLCLTIFFLWKMFIRRSLSRFQKLRTNPAFADFTDAEIQFLLDTTFPEEGLYLLLKDKERRKKQLSLKQYCKGCGAPIEYNFIKCKYCRKPTKEDSDGAKASWQKVKQST